MVEVVVPPSEDDEDGLESLVVEDSDDEEPDELGDELEDRLSFL